MERAPTPSEGSWIAKPRRPRWSIVPFVGVSAFILQTPAFLAALYGKSPWTTVATLILAGLFLGLALIAAIRQFLDLRMRAADHALVDGGFGDQYPVEMTVVVDGKRVGTDRGVAWFADDLIGFSGDAASFVLAATDLAPQWMATKRQPSDPQSAPPSDAVVLRGAPKTAYLTISPLLGHGRAYRRRFRDFIRAGCPSHLPRQWPPLEAYEGSGTRLARRSSTSP